MSLSQLSVPLTKEQAYQLVDAVMERDDLAMTASAHEAEHGDWVFEATCADAPDIAAFETLAREVLGGDVEFTAEPIDPDFDWVSKSLEGLKPVVAGGFYVYGSHHDAPKNGGLTPIHIDAAQAFGTGHHETTTGCLEAITDVLKRRKPAYMIDVGTGTGVLAIALAKRTKHMVLASDIDPVSVRVTEENARLNGVANDILAFEATGLDHATIRANAPYDLLVANILAGPLTELAPAIGRAAAPGANVILSGLLNTQAARVIAAYRQQGFVLQKRYIRKEWQTLLLEKPLTSRGAW